MMKYTEIIEIMQLKYILANIMQGNEILLLPFLVPVLATSKATGKRQLNGNLKEKAAIYVPV